MEDTQNTGTASLRQLNFHVNPFLFSIPLTTHTERQIHLTIVKTLYQGLQFYPNYMYIAISTFDL